MILEPIPNSFLEVIDIGSTDYEQSYAYMQDVVNNFNTDTLIVTEHLPVFTLGQAAKPHHIRCNTYNIPIVKTNRGGEVTYHGPGQLIFYPIIKLKNKNLNIKQYLHLLEDTIINLLKIYNIMGHRVQSAPGIYVNNAKIASIGLRVSRGICYHGLSLNVSPSLQAFECINTCGYENLQVASLESLGVTAKINKIKKQLLQVLNQTLNFTVKSYYDKKL